MPEHRITRLRLDDALQVAVALHKNGDLLEARELYRSILRTVPEQGDALHFLGVVSHQLGDGPEAVDLVRRAIAVDPTDAGRHNNLGNILKEQGRLEEAEEAYRRALELAPESADGHNNLGVVLKTLDRLDEAIDQYQHALALDPEAVETHHNLGVALKLRGRWDKAVAASERALALRPGFARARRNLADTYRRSGRMDEAVRVVREWLAFDPGHPVATHLLAAFGASETPDRASDGYVTAVFDLFAGTFDDVLARLDYAAPDLVAKAVAAAIPVADGRLDVLDAGCGTGLCGPLLRPYARRLVGVDLSGPMIERARRRGGYDALVVAELTGFLAGTDERFDLIVSADTLVYVGNLAPVLGVARRRLRPGGCLVFTVEDAGDDAGDRGFRLEDTGRYVHAGSYVRATLEASGFPAFEVGRGVLRKERGLPVDGLVVTARCPAAEAPRC